MSTPYHMTPDETYHEPQDDRLRREHEQAEEEKAIQDILYLIADRLKTDRTSYLRAYIWYRRQFPNDTSRMSDATATHITQELDEWIAKTLDDRDGMVQGSRSPRS